MALTREQIDFVAECIANGVEERPDAIRVDVSAIGDRFNLPWKAARALLQAVAKELGHRMVGSNSSMVTRSLRQVPPSHRRPTPQQRAISTIESLLSPNERKAAEIPLEG
jgi:hypothetical protein